MPRNYMGALEATIQAAWIKSRLSRKDNEASWKKIIVSWGERINYRGVNAEKVDTF